jgi:predicted helicase
MSRLSIQTYYQELPKIIHYGGSRKETALRGAFQKLLNDYCEAKNFLLIPELDYRTRFNTLVRPDGTVKDALRLPWGYWEAKDEFDDLDKEIQAKLAKGYPTDNILFEDSKTGVLIQNGQEVLRVTLSEETQLEKLLQQFINYQRPEVRDFRLAIAKFKADLPTILQTLRHLLDMQAQTNPRFVETFDQFLELCTQAINPRITALEVQEMLLQHLLTEDIFLKIFDESQFHGENPIAQKLGEVVATFFTHDVKRNTLASIKSYYAVIQREAAAIVNHHEKQKFLKVVYENFYKIYNPKAADRLGIVYTPNEIVRFMIESVDYLLDRHFGRLLADNNVEILDPATGTGTFIAELIDYLPTQQLEYKYLHEIHANEVAILPYYIANLNIEYTFQQKMGKYVEFPNLCWVDTLQNLDFAHTYQHKQEDLQLDLFFENAVRIRRQNERKISVIIGNPPYNANQQNENDNNPNLSYPPLDEAIKRTYIASSTAQKTKLYDMYARFFRWASNRLNENGILAFVTNNSFLNARTFDGFRKVVNDEFASIYVLDLGGDVRKNPQLSGTKHNVFGIQTGVAISFLVKQAGLKSPTGKIFYARRPEMDTAAEKLQFLQQVKFKQIEFERIVPDQKHTWINLVENDFESLLPLVSKKTKATKQPEEELAVLKLFSNGVVTARDEWVYDFSVPHLTKRIKFFLKVYHHSTRTDSFDLSIKWSEALKNHAKQGKRMKFESTKIIPCFYRPFLKMWFYSEKILNDRLTEHHYGMFGEHLDQENRVITTMGDSTGKPFFVLGINALMDLNFVSPASGGTRCFPLYRYNDHGDRLDNLTDWGLEQFRQHYLSLRPRTRNIQKLDIFHYTYAVLHDPKYRQKYEQNLKRDFPRLPCYPNFWQWVEWGQQLMELHLNYEEVEKYPLTRLDQQLAANVQNKVKLKADKVAGKILMDDQTTLTGVPALAWEYKLGNRSALEWILDQYKEKKPKDPTIAEKFNTYRLADYKEEVIELLQRVCMVSVKTMAIVLAMREEPDWRL